MIQPHRVDDASQWDALVLSLPAPHPLQSEAWARHKMAHGWHPERWAYHDEGGRLRGAALALRRRAGRLPLGIVYVPKGPLLDDWADPALVRAVLSHLEGLARRRLAVFLKIDPDVDRAPAPDLCAVQGASVADSLERRGWRFSTDQIQYRNTVLLDLRPTPEELLAAMKPKTRYNIRLAERRGVRVRAGSPGDLPAFFALYAETGARDGFLIRDYDYYHSAWRTFMDAGMGRLLLAEVDGQVVAGVFLFLFGRRAWYIYGASSSAQRELMPNHLLQWEAAQWARAAGCDSYDLWGAPDELREDDPMWGVYRFKEGFGGSFVCHIGAWDYPTSRLLYWAYTQVAPRYLSVLRRRAQPADAGA
jgi:peptidoglycan pentaglycine glycine transferase (the first glycine)